MKVKILYIDDQKINAEGLIKPLQSPEFEIIVEEPKTWNSQKDYLHKVLPSYDGLLLDLRLEFQNEENNIKFNGADLAQAIRSDVIAGHVKDLPIFLCSTDSNFIAFFDRTSIDLFDNKYVKDKNLNSEKTKQELISFSKAYKSVQHNSSVKNIMQKDVGENDELVALQSELKNFKTPHEFVYLINRYVIHGSGMLIDEDLLAIRLGIDIQLSSDWQTIKESLIKSFKYNGILGDCYQRWWQSEILKWWKENVGKSLKVMSAQEKVSVLIEKFGLKNITALTLPKYHRFDTFWYKCRLSVTPLDPSDALRTTEMPRYLWQEPSYISLAYIKSDGRSREDIIHLLGANELKIFETL